MKKSIALVVIVLALISCSKKKNTLLKRTYHNVTALYNGYFNAKLKIDNYARSQEQAFQDKYDELLPVYKIAKVDKAEGGKGGSSNQALDDAIKKASIVVQRHEISRWVDDCYLEIGRANFYKKDYYTAAENFQFIAGKYKDTETGNQAYVWMIRCYLQLNKLNQAEQVLNVALASETFPKKYLPELFTAAAAFHISKKNYTKAIEYLDKATPIQKDKKSKARLSYINAQVNEMMLEEARASKLFLQCLSYKPGYEMTFNAKMNASRLSQSKTANSRKNLEKELNKMLKDDKNKDYRDQIYYSLGLIHEKDKNILKAIQAYKRSAQTSTLNTNQKGKSYLKLATIYFDDQQYENAQYYYDSTYTFLSKTHPDYELIVKRKTSLLKLVDNLNVIKREDSLLRLAKMPEKDRIALVDKIIAEEKLEKEKRDQEQRDAAAAALNNMSKPNQTTRPGSNGGSSAGSIWYFYNQNALSLGSSDFTSKWGKRNLEDNWRRSNKQSYATLLTTEEESQETGSEKKTGGTAKNSDEQIKKRYLANIPNTPEQQRASTEKMVRAYYNIGLFYRTEIVNIRESINAYETALKRFPGNNLCPEIYFNLYRIYAEQNNTKQSSYYKNKILNDFPNSLFAKVIIDPNYVSEAKAIDQQAQHLYDSIYIQYKVNQFESVLAFKPSIDSFYASTSVAPKYYLLYALSQSKINGVEAMEQSLNKLITNYPSSDAASTARNILQKIAESKDPSAKKEESKVQFSKDTKGKFYVLISTDMKATLRDTKNNLQRFNVAEFSLLNLTLSTELLDDQNQLIMIKDFDQAEKASAYISALKKQSLEVIALGTSNFAVSLISDNNYKILQKSKNMKEYIDFYKQNYPKND